MQRSLTAVVLGLVVLAAAPAAAFASASHRAPAVEVKLRARLGAAYAGAWLDGGTLRVAVTDRARVDDARAAGAQPRVVRHSAAELEAIKADLDRRAASAPDTVAGWGVDVPTNSTVIRVVGDDPKALAFAEAQRARHDAVRIEHVARAPQPLWDLVGGAGIFFPGAECSVGFNAYSAVGARYVLTAGHCGSAGARVSRPEGPIGAVEFNSFPGDDYAGIKVTSPQAASGPWVRGQFGSTLNVVGSATVPIGGQVCKSGVTTGWTCGVVRGFDQTVNYEGGGTVSGLTTTTLCADHGDSGGAVVSRPNSGTDVQAQGLVSGGLDETCDPQFTLTYFQPVGEVLQARDLALYTATDAVPTAGNDVYQTDEGTTLTVAAPGVLEDDEDPHGEPLRAFVDSQPAHGTLVLRDDGSFDYTPAPGYAGIDDFTYHADAGGRKSNTATVTLAIYPRLNQPPVATDNAYGVEEDGSVTVGAPGVLGNDTDADGDPLTATLVTGPAHAQAFELRADGSFTYRPAPNFYGNDSFTYRAGDGTASSATATVTLVVRPINDAPAAAGDTYAVDEDTDLSVAAPGVLRNDTDVEDDPFTAALVTGPAHGTLTLRADGSFTYRPEPNYNGPDSFSYRASDGNASSAPATVTIAVRAVNDAPFAGDDAYSTVEDQALEVPAPGVLDNDGDADGDEPAAVLASQPAHGTVTLNGDGSFVYRPAAGFNGSDAFAYRARDAAGADSALATVTVVVQPLADDIVFASSRTGNGDIYVLDPEAGTPHQLTSGSAVDAEPAWSPDRRRIAFTSTRDGNVELYVMNADGTGIVRLTRDPAVDMSPAWSPDGTRIAFASDRTKRQFDIYVAKAADGSGVTRLTTHPSDETLPAWAPDGTRIAYSSQRSGNGDIYVMDANGAGETRVTTSTGVDTEPDWAGNRIAFSTNRHGSDNFEIYTMTSSGAGQTRVTNQAGHDLTPAWSSDGRRLVFASNRNGTLNFELYVTNPDGTGQTRLTNHPAIDALPDW